MMELIAPLIEWIGKNPNAAGVFVFLISLSESLLVVGLFIPGVAMMTSIGALVGAGVLPIIPTLTYAILGAIVGDGLSYWIGKTYHHDIKRWRLIQKYPLLIEKGEVFFRRNGGKSIMLGRFLGPVRPIIPAVAGMLNMPPHEFFLYNVLSALAWAPAYTLPGVLFGSSFSTISLRATFYFLLLTLFILIAITMCYRVLRYAFMGIHIPLQRQLKKYWHQILSNPKFKPVEDLIANAYYPESHQPLGRCLWVLVLSGVMLALTYGALHPLAIHWSLLNETARHLVLTFQSPALDTFCVIVSDLATPQVILPFYLGILIFACAKKDFWTVGHGIALFVILLGLTMLLKTGTHSIRPNSGLGYLDSKSYSFPSGHTIRTLMVFGFWALVNTPPYTSTLFKKWLLTLAIIITIIEGYSRLYLNAHWLTDVLGAMILGTIGLILTEISYHRRKLHPSFSFAQLFFPFLIVLPFVLFQFSKTQQHVLLLQSQDALPEISTPSTDWWNGTRPRIPITRKALLGNALPTFNIQSATPWQTIAHKLTAQGWVEPPPLSLPNLLNWFDPRSTLSELPLFPQFHNNRAPLLTLMKKTDNPDRVLVLRFWKSRYQLSPDNTPLWLGTVHFQFRRHFWLFSVPYPEKNPEYDLNRAHDALKQDLASSMLVLKNMRTESPIPNAVPVEVLMIHDPHL